MVIKFNGTDITTPKWGTTTLGKVIFNGVTVFISALTQPTITRGTTGQTSVAWTVLNGSGDETVTIKTRVTGFTEKTITDVAPNTSTATQSQTGLSAGTAYSITAYAEVSGLAVSPTHTVNFTTDALLNPTLPSIVNRVGYPTHVVWEVRNNDTGTATTVHSYHKSPLGTYTWFYDYNITSGSNTQQFVKAIGAGVDYELGARVSVNGKTDEEVYATVTGTTPTITTPGTFTVIKGTGNTANMDWTDTNYHTSYLASYRVPGGTWTEYEVTDSAKTGVPIVLGESYEYRVRAKYETAYGTAYSNYATLTQTL